MKTIKRFWFWLIGRLGRPDEPTIKRKYDKSRGRDVDNAVQEVLAANGFPLNAITLDEALEIATGVADDLKPDPVPHELQAFIDHIQREQRPDS